MGPDEVLRWLGVAALAGLVVLVWLFVVGVVMDVVRAWRR